MKAKVIRAIAPDRMMKVDLNSDCNAFCRITAKKRNQVTNISYSLFFSVDTANYDNNH